MGKVGLTPLLLDRDRLSEVTERHFLLLLLFVLLGVQFGRRAQP
jgi:hypothetical protein